MSRAVKRAMVLAAGLGLRMRPITDRIPKPLVPVAGRTLLDRALDHLAAAGVERAVVNTHHKAALVAAHLAERRAPEIALSHEEALLETGGGVANALAQLGGDPFFVVNSDALWVDGYVPALARLAGGWDGRRMDALLLLHATVGAVGYKGRGDYFLEPGGRTRRRREGEVAPFVFAGVQILHPRLFESAPAGAFSLNLLYDRAEAAGRLFAIRHDGLWFHVGTPDSIELAESRLRGLDPARDWA